MLRLIISTLAAIALIGFTVIAENDTHAQTDAEVPTLEVRVIARPNEDGSIEFAVQYDGQRYLPEGRHLTRSLADSNRGRWLSSTPVELVGPISQPLALLGAGEYRDTDGQWETPHFGRAVEIVRVHARPLSDDRIEFALSHDGESYLPETRFLTPRLVEERVGHWLRSSPIDIPTDAMLSSDWVRHYSTDWNADRIKDDIYDWQQESPPADIARSCVLTELSNVTDAVLGLSYRSADYIANEVERTSEMEHLVRLDRGEPVVALLSKQDPDIHRDWKLGDLYGFIVEAEQYGQFAIWWLAEFSCADDEDAPTGNIEPSDGASGDLE